MGKDIQVRMISREDILSAGCFDIASTISVIEKALIAYKNNKIVMPEKISQIFDEKSQNRINCMPATLKEEKVCGVKWVSVFPGNPVLYNCPNVSGLIVLSELERGFPFAIMDGTFLTALRTACMGAIAAKHLARKDSIVLGSLGSGEQAKMHFMTMKHVIPTIKLCRVASQTVDEEEAYIEQLSVKYPDVTFEKCNTDFEKASEGADVIVTAVSCQKPLLKARTVKQGAFYCHVGGWEDEYEVVKKADKIVCDCWEAVKHRTQTISRMYQEGMLKDNDIYADIVDLVDGTKNGRESATEFNYFNSVGLGFIDVAVAYGFYKRVNDCHLGKMWQLQ